MLSITARFDVLVLSNERLHFFYKKCVTFGVRTYGAVWYILGLLIGGSIFLTLGSVDE